MQGVEFSYLMENHMTYTVLRYHLVTTFSVMPIFEIYYLACCSYSSTVVVAVMP